MNLQEETMTITRKNDAANKNFWRSASEARTKVDEWPEWKRNLRVTKYSIGFTGKPSKHDDNGEKK